MMKKKGMWQYSAGVSKVKTTTQLPLKLLCSHFKRVRPDILVPSYEINNKNEWCWSQIGPLRNPTAHNIWSSRISAMHDASRRLQDCLADMYDPEWFGKEEMDTLVEVRPWDRMWTAFFSSSSSLLLFAFLRCVSFSPPLSCCNSLSLSQLLAFLIPP